jgi:hypothetical protein
MKRPVDLFALIVGVAYAVIGVLFLLDQSGDIKLDAGLVWPILLITGGAAAALNGWRRDR